jgi:hypothetical protein
VCEEAGWRCDPVRSLALSPELPRQCLVGRLTWPRRGWEQQGWPTLGIGGGGLGGKKGAVLGREAGAW